MTTADDSVQDDYLAALLGDFLDEAGELLDKLNADLLTLDHWAGTLQPGQRQACDDNLMNSMFRAAHSFKGLSAMLGLTEINHLTHKVENIFDAARQEKLFINSGIVELLFHAHDRLTDMVRSLHDPKPVEVRCDKVLDEIEALLAEAGVEKSRATQQDAEAALAEQTQTAATTAPEQEIIEPTPDPTPSSPAERTYQAPPPSAPPPAPEIDHMEGVVDEGGIPSKYLSIFIDETESAIDTLTETLLQQESDLNASATETLLILSHRIKGSSASVGLNRMAKFAHLMEDLLQILREAGATPTPHMTDVLLKCVDAMRAYVNGFKEGNPDCSQFSPLCNELIRLQKHPEGPPPEPSATETPADAGHDAMPPESAAEPDAVVPAANDTADVGSCLKEISDRIGLAVAENANGVVGRVYFQPEFPLVGIKARLLHEKLSQLGNVIYCEPPAEVLEGLDELDHLDFAVETAATVEEVVSQLRIVSVTNVTAEPLLASSLAASSDEPLEVELPLTAAPPADVPVDPISLPLEETVATAQQSMVAEEKRVAATPTGRPTETLRVDIERLDQLMNLAGQLVINKARFGRIGDSLRQTVSGNRASKSLGNSFTALEKIDALLNGNEFDQRKDQSSLQLDNLRAHVRAIQGDLDAIRREYDKLNDARSTVADLSDAVHQLERVADGIQCTVMDTRMVPIGPLFARFRRVVRDITRGSGKEILLTIRGEKTELDKRMIDELSDPLIHMVRNSADHGIESPDQRLAAGKARQGSITLDAFHRGNNIVVQVTDDGRGLDVERIRAKAIEREIITAADAERLSTHQLQNLIWEPGFTTAEKVTEISGRGMGMDIVKSKIEEINGSVELESVYGEGTVFSIKLPLTLAILPSLMAQINGDVYSLPIESVVEIVSIGPDDVSTVHSLPTARVRGRVIPIVYLDETFQFHGASCAPRRVQTVREMTLVVIGCEGEEIGLAVDKVLGEEDVVIKSLAENYRNVQGIAGASILGDGRVSLILDITALVEMSTRAVPALHQHEEQA